MDLPIDTIVEFAGQRTSMKSMYTSITLSNSNFGRGNARPHPETVYFCRKNNEWWCLLWHNARAWTNVQSWTFDTQTGSRVSIGRAGPIDRKENKKHKHDTYTYGYVKTHWVLGESIIINDIYLFPKIVSKLNLIIPQEKQNCYTKRIFKHCVQENDDYYSTK